MRIPDRAPAYVLTDRFVEECLIGDGTLLEPETDVWTRAHLEEVRVRFIEAPDDSQERSFEEKLTLQFDDAPQTVRRLFAEIRLVQMAPMADISASSKISEVTSLLSLLDVDSSLPQDVQEAAEYGFANVGMARVNKYWHLCFIIDRALAFKRLDVVERREMLSDRRAWKAFVLDSGIDRVGVQENLWLHLGMPDQFQPIASSSDKDKIVEGLSDLGDGSGDVDDALLAIQAELVDRYGPGTWPYDPAVRELWDPDATAAPVQHPDEERWRSLWAAEVVDAYREAGGAPTIAEGQDHREETQAALERMSETGDVEQFLTWTKSVDGLRQYWSGPYTSAVRGWTASSDDPMLAAQKLARALHVPDTDEQAAARIRELSAVREEGGGGLWAPVLADAVWHWQDPAISPWTMASSDALSSRGWWNGADDSGSVWYLRWQENMSSFGPDIRWFFAALNHLDSGQVGLLFVPTADLERCGAAAAGDDVDLRPALVDLEALAAAHAARSDLGDWEAARSVADGPDVWVELRHQGSCLIRLWLTAGSLTLCRPTSGDDPADGDLPPVELDDELLRGRADTTRWEGITLNGEDAGDPQAVAAAFDRVALQPVGDSLPVEMLFEEFQAQLDEQRLEDKRAEREELAEALTPAALKEPDLDALRQIINTGKYGSPGPMSTLNRSLNEANQRDGLRSVGRVIDRLCNGDAPPAERIDQALSAGIAGLGESVVMKLLAITHPDEILPVFPYTGDHGKQAMLDLLGLPRPDSGLSKGERQMAANDRLLQVVRPLSDDPWERNAFLYWLLDRSRPADDAAEPVDDEDRIEAAARRCFVDREWLDDLVGLLDDRGQIVLYGPPGTGKTFIAQQLAAALAPSEHRRRLVQFHPAYGYEDFFEGLRPRTSDQGTLTYELVDGPLKRIAAAAAADGDREYVLVIDEINRANLPKVFGELLFLLEYRREAISTMYGGEPFELPDNLAIIATMNTADRSIALVDAALRRRFHFVPLFPDRPPISGTLRRWLSANDEDPRIADLVDDVNSTLRDRLGGPHLQIGPSHFMTDNITERIDQIWRYSIEPLIEEQLYGDEAAIDELRWDALVSSRWNLTATEPAGPTAEPAPTSSEPDGNGPA